MKAIACPQCGALIKKVSVRQTMIVCDYCGANVLMPRDENYFLDVEESGAKRIASPNENIKKSGTKIIWNSPFSDLNAYNETFQKDYKRQKNYAPAITALCVGFFVFIAIIAGISSKKRTAQTLVSPTPYIYSTPIPSFTPLTIAAPNAEDEPDVTFDLSYRVSWDSSIAEQHIELPTLKDADFPSSDLKTLKKTVFAQKIIRVKIRIDENGEVKQAKAVSGHKLLKDAAETAALASYFSERRKPIDTVLIYYFEIKQIE